MGQGDDCMLLVNPKYKHFIKDNKYKLIVSTLLLSGTLVLASCADNKPAEVNEPVEISAVENSEKDVASYFKDMEKAVDNMLSSDSAKNMKKDATDIFITGVDFLFYGGKIKGYTFDELSADAKADVIKSMQTIDEKIDKKFPGYKEDISKEYNKGKGWLKEKFSNLKDITKDELGEESWESLLDTKVKIKDAGSSLLDSASKVYKKTSNKVNDWYLNFKDKHE